MSDYRPNGRNEEAYLPNTGPLYTSVIAPSNVSVVDGVRIASAADVAALTFRGADTLKDALNTLPHGLDLYGSYTDNFQGFVELEAMKHELNPDAVYLSITIFGGRARVADMEPGAMGIGEFGHWYDNTADHSQGAVAGYTSASNMAALISAANGRPFVRWSAHYGLGPHVCAPHICGFPEADMTQWNMQGPQGQNYDPDLGHAATLARLRPRPPVPADPMHYAFYDDKVRTELKGHPVGSERAAVELYDKLRAMQTPTNHPHRAEAEHLKREIAWYRDRLGDLMTANAARGKRVDCESQRSKANHWCWRYYRLAKRAHGDKVNP